MDFKKGLVRFMPNALCSNALLTYLRHVWGYNA
jgi:hypothetical protein